MKTSALIEGTLAAALATAPLPALAETSPPPYYEPPGVSRPAEAPPRRGLELSVGGGVMNYTNSTARSLTDIGGSWDVRLSLGTRSILGLELAYVGSVRGVSLEGLDPKAALMANGGEVALRFNIPIVVGSGLIEPFAIGGIGWSHYTLVHDSFNTSSLAGDDDIGTVPLGVGLAGSLHGFMVDARVTYRPTFQDKLFGGTNDLQSWAATANIGFEF
jgi:hypothetical protein